MLYKEAWEKITSQNSILLASHIRPDGDTLGSVLALYLVLKRLKKRVRIYNPSKCIPKKFDFLPNIGKIVSSFDASEFDVIVSCDCGSLDRLCISKKDSFIVNIDHHKTNDYYGNINVIDQHAPSASFVVYKLLKQNGVEITKDIATCLYVGFVEDTGFFSYGNLSAKVIKMVAELVSCGVDMGDVARELRQKMPLSQARLRQHIYNNFYLIKNAMVAVCVVAQEDLKRIGCEIEDTKNISNIIRALATVRLSILLVELDCGGYKVSLRSKSDIDVSDVAKVFQGGGHAQAAGFETELTDADVLVCKILENIKL